VNRAWKADRTLGTTKTNDERVLPLPANTIKALGWWRKESEFTAPADLIFHGLGGGRTPLESSTLVRCFPRALGRAEIVVGPRNLVTHSLRHGFNSLCRPLLPEGALHSLTGHKTSEMSQLYDHPDIKARMQKIEPFRGLIEAAWSGKRQEKGAGSEKVAP
jgi:integrase